MKPIPYARHQITKKDIQAVISALRSNNLTQGPRITEFEEAFASYIGVKYAVAVSNGTAALHLSTLALGVKSGDKVITTPITFSATANCVGYAGGEVIFADIDPKTYLLDIEKVKEILSSNPKGTFKGIIPVDLSGRAVDLEAFRILADKYECWILEDACHAPGGYFINSEGRKIYCGNGEYADLSIFSFHPAKHIAAGEGGMITTNDKDLYDKLILLRTHGITKDPDLMIENHGPWYYEMQELGYNYRLTDIQAALGISQLRRAEKGLNRRKDIATIYENAFRNAKFVKNQSGLVDGHAYHLYIAEFENRDGLIDHLRQNNIYPQVHYIPVHLMPYYKRSGWNWGDMPYAENYYKHALSLPMYPTLKNREIDRIIGTICNYY